jgi:hypothetical protein
VQLLRFILFALALSGPLTAAPKIWLDDNFADGERDQQNLPASAGWFSSSVGGTLTVTTGALTQYGGGRYVLAYFAPADAPARIAPGETLVLTYRITLEHPLDGPGALRVGLFNSGAQRIVADKQAQSPDFAGYLGYMGATNPVPTKNAPLRLFKRVPGKGTLIANLTSFDAISEPAGSLQTMQDGETYTGTLTIRRSASGSSNAITHGFYGNDLRPNQATAVDSVEPITVFDTVVIHAGTKAAHGFTLKAVRIETLTD